MTARSPISPVRVATFLTPLITNACIVAEHGRLASDREHHLETAIRHTKELLVRLELVKLQGRHRRAA